MRVWRLLTRRMAAKIFLVIGLVVGAALLLQARADARRIEDSLKRETHIAAEQVAQLVIGSVAHSMLAGDGIQVKGLVGDLKKRVPGAEIHVYDRRGVEVFAPKGPAPDPDLLPSPVREALAGRERADLGAWRVVRAIDSEKRCQRCHDDDRPVRGVLQLVVDPDTCRKRRDRVFAELVRHGFVQMMTAKQTKRISQYFRELVATDGAVRGVAVYDNDGDLAFGDPAPVPEAQLAAALAPGGKPTYLPDAGGVSALLPLPMEERCSRCHDDEIGAARGALVVALKPAAAGDCGVPLEMAIDRSLRFIMLAALGRRVADFLDAVVATGAASQIDVFDSEGRRQWTTARMVPPPDVAAVLRSKAGQMRFVGTGAREKVQVIEPLHNDDGCRRCHGADSDLRGAVRVSLSTRSAASARAATMHQSGWFTGYTLGGVLFILVGLLQYLVVRPVNHIGAVADEVGRGNLDVSVGGARSDGDEIARLGQRVNEMVHDLRAKLHLEKLVSRGAAEAAAGGIERRGELRRFTVLFSDIRGFTAYAEERSPAEVVDALNELLGAQATAVHQHGGDVDKYVGDELMALFHGDDAEQRALACALDIIDAVARAGRGALSVGVGIHAGDVVYGAIGSDDRLDFTVIGDVVNTAARLCSAAEPQQILVSAEISQVAGSDPTVSLESLEPLALKGKRKPFPVMAARRSDA